MREGHNSLSGTLAVAGRVGGGVKGDRASSRSDGVERRSIYPKGGKFTPTPLEWLGLNGGPNEAMALCYRSVSLTSLPSQLGGGNSSR